MVSDYMEQTKQTVNASTTNESIDSQPSTSGDVSQPSTSGDVTYFRPATSDDITVFRPATKANWKREKDDEGSDSDDSQTATVKLTSDHSSDLYVSDDESDVSVLKDMSLEISVPHPDPDRLYE